MARTTVMSATSSPTASSPALRSPASASSATAAPATTSSTTPSAPQRTTMPRPMSHASKHRLSQYSTGSGPSRSRPPSYIPPMFISSLPYALVRDFAYPATHPLHYGPPLESSAPPSGATTPASEHRRLSDQPGPWEQKMPWDSWTADGFNRGHDIPPISFGDGPPYSEDEDLQSPVVATRHRKHKSTSAAMGSGRGQDSSGSGLLDPTSYDSSGGYYPSTNRDESERYYVPHSGGGSGGGDLAMHPPGSNRRNRAYHYAQQPQQDEGDVSEGSSSASSPGQQGPDQSRYSRDYQFTITSPDEEFHGKAVALFDFERENENELPLVEGQIIWVSYRHGQGWLVAEDPKTQESGLVPEEYVRLLRDIEGGMNSLTGPLGELAGSPPDVGTPTQAEHGGQFTQNTAISQGANGYHQPVVSMFSTSSKDLNPYPTEQLGIQSGQAPPQVVHYQGQKGGSQMNTPTAAQHGETIFLRRESLDTTNRGDVDGTPVQDKHGSSAARGGESIPEGTEG